MIPSEHDQRVSSLVSFLSEKGYKIVAAIYPESPFPKPVAVGRHEPDIIGKIGDCIVVGEAKTEDDYNTEHSMEQYYDFGNSKASKVYLHLPCKLHQELWFLLKRLGVSEKYTLVYYSREKV